MQPIRVLQQVNTTTCNWARLEKPLQAGLPFAQNLHALDASETLHYLIIYVIIKQVLINLQYIGTCLNCWKKSLLRMVSLVLVPVNYAVKDKCWQRVPGKKGYFGIGTSVSIDGRFTETQSTAFTFSSTCLNAMFLF